MNASSTSSSSRILAVGVGQRLQDGAQDRDGVGASAVERRSRLARWRAASTRRDGSAAPLRDAGEHPPAVLVARVIRNDRPRSKSTASTSSGAGGSASARSSSRAASSSAPSRRAGVGGTAQRRHDLGVTARRRAASGARRRAGRRTPSSASSAAARACSSAASIAAIASRAAAATTGWVKPYARGVEHPLDAQLLLGGDRPPLALEPGERARPA